jgi:hypothetical protein
MVLKFDCRTLLGFKDAGFDTRTPIGSAGPSESIHFPRSHHVTTCSMANRLEESPVLFSQDSST